MSNLKQIGIAMMMYVQDYDETYPNALYSVPTSWTGADFPDGKAWNAYHTLYWPQMLYPYHKSDQVFYCPSSPGTNQTAPVRLNYGANQILIAYSSSAVKMAAVVAPATTYMVMDSSDIRTSSTYAKTATSPYYLPGMGDAGGDCTPISTTDHADCQSGRHFGSVNVAFADGHVKWLKSSVVRTEALKTTPLAGAWNFSVDNSGS